MIGLEGPCLRVPLGRLGAWRTGNTPSKSVGAYWKDGEMPWVSPKDFGPAVIMDAIDGITEAALSSGGGRTVPAGSLMVVSRSGVLRHSLPVAVAGRELAINQDVRALLPTPGIDAGFIRHQLLAVEQRILQEVVRRGTTVQSLDDASFRGFELTVPPPTEQRRIASALDRLDARLESIYARVGAARRHCALLREQILAGAWDGGLAARWRSERGRDDDRRTARVEDVAESIAYGSSSKSRRAGDVAVLRMGNIRNGGLDWTDLVFTSDPDEIARHLLVDGDVLFNRTNSPELVGKTAVYHGERPAIAAGYNIVVRCGPRVLPDFLAHLLNGPAGREWARSVRSDGVNQSNISGSKLAAFQIPIPPLDEQGETLRLVDAALGTIARAIAELDWVENDCAELARTVRAAAFRTTDAHERSTPELLSLTEAMEAAVRQHGEDDRERRRRMAARRAPARSLEDVIGERADQGMTFAELLAAVGSDYEVLRASVFALLSTEPPRLRQHFDEAERTMRLKVATR